MSNFIIPQSEVNVNGVGNECYSLTRDNFNALMTLVNTATFFDDLSLIFTNPQESIISARLYPFDMLLFTGGRENVVFSGGFDTGISAYKVKNTTFSPVPLAIKEISPLYNSFLDYEPYRKLSIYLPYYGYANLNINEIIGYIITVYGVPDFTTGDFTYFLTRKKENWEEELLDSYTCKCSVDISLNFSNFNESVKDLTLHTVGSAITSTIALATKSKLAGAVVATEAGSLITSIPDTMAQHVIKNTASSNTTLLYQPNKIHLLDERIKINPFNHITFKGRPCYKTYTLNELQGYTQILNCRLTGFDNAFNSEVNEIESLLKQGVIL